MESLDKKNLRILQELDLDARQSTTQIAKSIGLSQEVTTYRIKKLEETGIIKGYYSLINVYSLGYCLYRIYLSLNSLNDDKKQEFLDYLIKTKQVGQVAITGGNYDLIIGVIEKSNLTFQNIVNDIINKYGVYIKNKEISIITELWQYNKKFLLPEKNLAKDWHFYEKNTTKIDETDTKILDIISENGRKTSTEIEKETKTSRKVVANRIKKLTQEGVILGSRVVLKRNFQNKQYFRILLKLQSTDDKKINSLIYYFKTHTATVYSLKCIGSWELETELIIENIEKCYQFLYQLKNNYEIIRETTVIPLFKDLKYQFSLS